MGIPGTASRLLAWALHPGGAQLNLHSWVCFAVEASRSPEASRSLHQELASRSCSLSESCFPSRGSGCFPNGHRKETTRYSRRVLCRPNTPGLVGIGRNESRPLDLPWLWAGAQLSLTSPAVRGTRWRNESKTCLGAAPAGSWGQVGRILRQDR